MYSYYYSTEYKSTITKSFFFEVFQFTSVIIVIIIDCLETSFPSLLVPSDTHCSDQLMTAARPSIAVCLSRISTLDGASKLHFSFLATSDSECCGSDLLHHWHIWPSWPSYWRNNPPSGFLLCRLLFLPFSLKFFHFVAVFMSYLNFLQLSSISSSPCLFCALHVQNCAYYLSFFYFKCSTVFSSEIFKQFNWHE